MGPGRLKLGVDLETRYDSEAGRGHYGALMDPGDAVGLLRVVALLDADTPSTRVNLSGGLGWNHYFGAFTSATSGLSFLEAKILGGVAFNPKGKLGVDLTTNLDRSDQIANPVFGLGVLGLRNTTRARLRYRPGGGTLDMGAFYEFAADIYSRHVLPTDPRSASGLCSSDPTCNPDLAAAFNTLGHKVGVDAKWRFLPKTGLSLEVDYGTRDYTYGTEFIANASTQPLRALAGFGTLLTTRLSFSFRAGYQALFYTAEAIPSVHSWLGQAELGYRLTETFQVTAGYDRTFTPVGTALLFYVDDRGYVDFKAQFSRLVLQARLQGDLISYGGGPRTDLAFAATAGAEYHLTNWLRFMLGGAVYARGVSNIPQSADSAYDYTRWEAKAGVGTLF